MCRLGLELVQGSLRVCDSAFLLGCVDTRRAHRWPHGLLILVKMFSHSAQLLFPGIDVGVLGGLSV